MKPYYEQDGITIYHGDCLSVLAALPNGAADVIFTDPPYSSGGLMRGDRIRDVHTKYVQSNSVSGHKMAAFTGDNRDQRSFGFWVALWLGESMRVVKPGGLAALFTDWRQLPVTTDALQAGGYVWRGIVPWHKPCGRPQLGRWANSCEYVVWGTNGPRELTGKAFPGFYSLNAPSQRDHIRQKPIELMVSMLKIVPAGGCVLDPFIGSGTTLLAAKQRGIGAIGCEVNEAFCEIAAKRLEQARAQQSLPLEVSA